MLLDTLLIAVSSQCDQTCSYCYLPASKRAADSGTLEPLLDKLQSLEVRRMALIGAEPTQVDLSSYARALQPLCGDITIQSHGVNLTPDKQDQLRFCTLGFSMDGPEHIHNRFRKHYVKVRANYDYAVRSNIPTQVSICITPYTVDHLDDFEAWLDNLGPTKLICNLVYGGISVDAARQRKFGKWLRKYPQLYPAVTRTIRSCKHDGNGCRHTLEVDLHGGVYSCSKAFHDGGAFADWKVELWEDIIAKRELLYEKAKVSEACSNCPIQCRAACAITRIDGKALDCEVQKGFWYE